MRPIGIGLAAALLVAVLAPATVSSAPKKPPAVSEAARKQGMADAPAVAQAAGLSCQVTDARFMGKAKTSSFYEVDCSEGPGFILEAKGAEPPAVFSCIDANTSPGPGKEPATPCILPGNADPKADLAPAIAKAGVQCTPKAVRGIGQSKTNSYMEVACQEGPGYILIASAPLDIKKTVEAQNCLNFDDGESTVKCILSDKASRLAVVDTYAAAAKNNCAVKDRRYIGMAKDGANYFEASCQDGKGYIYKIDAKGALAQTFGCAQALGVLGGCTLTDAREAATAQADLYSRLAKAAGSNCDVDKYAVFPSSPGLDVVELVCKDGAGGVGVFKSAGKSVVYDCGHALIAGYRCGLNKMDTANSALTADLRKFDQKTCVVSNSRLAAKTTKGTVLLEVACADGYKGYMIEYNPENATAIGATGCAFASGCKLPGNT
jgi:hypothetical protein